MSEEEQTYLAIGQSIHNAQQSQMFGKPCFKINGKAFICYFRESMVFKLTGDTHVQALNLDDSKLFDPSDKGRAMKEWVQVPYTHKAFWPKFASEAASYISDN